MKDQFQFAFTIHFSFTFPALFLHCSFTFLSPFTFLQFSYTFPSRSFTFLSLFLHCSFTISFPSVSFHFLYFSFTFTFHLSFIVWSLFFHLLFIVLSLFFHCFFHKTTFWIQSLGVQSDPVSISNQVSLARALGKILSPESGHVWENADKCDIKCQSDMTTNMK